ncbi:hypothetical protein BGZ83_003624 [Gryganskiella cystojenkinii]|nr:hypothetical protein BGZ83_003624 [Gryganskiella cystojenkinii]
MPVLTTTLSTDPVLTQQHRLTVNLDDTSNTTNSTSDGGRDYRPRTISATILTYGATLTHLSFPDRWNEPQDVVLGFDHWQEYLAQAQPGALNPYFGAIIGRTASRIAHAQFILDSSPPQSDVSVSHKSIDGSSAASAATGTSKSATTSHTLQVSNGLDCHHGGPRGFDKMHWTTLQVDQDRTAVRLQLISPHGDNGYPGRLVTTVEYQLTPQGELKVEFWAKLEQGNGATATTADLHSTIVSLTNHTYWNLDGVLNPVKKDEPTGINDLANTSVIRNQGTIKDHWLQLNSAYLIELGASHPVPTGRVIDLVTQQDYPQRDLLDFRTSKRLGPGLEQIPGGFGYDNVYALQGLFSKPVGELGSQGHFPETPLAATLVSPHTGIRMDLLTSEPALVVYAAGYLEDSKLHSTKSKSLDVFSSSFILSPAAPLTATAFNNHQGQGNIKIEAGYDKFAGISLEPIRYPDAIHHPDWASMVTLHAGQEYRQRTIYKLSIEK